MDPPKSHSLLEPPEPSVNWMGLSMAELQETSYQRKITRDGTKYKKPVLAAMLSCSDSGLYKDDYNPSPKVIAFAAKLWHSRLQEVTNMAKLMSVSSSGHKADVIRSILRHLYHLVATGRSADAASESSLPFLTTDLLTCV